MADTFDPDAALAADFPETEPAFDPDAALAMTIVDENKPKYANGGSAETPLNQSPQGMTPEIRRALSVGNDKGIEKKLIALGYEAKKHGGAWSVKDPADASWKLVDPNIESDNAWDFAANAVKAATAAGLYLSAPIVGITNAAVNAVAGTDLETNAIRLAAVSSDAIGLGDVGRETISEFVENEGTAVNIAANVGVALATGGSSIPVQLAAAAALGVAIKAGETSFGRLADTYDATPEEQLMDAGLEGLMNAAGTGVALGAKPVLSWFGRTAPVKKIGDMLASVGDESFNAIKALYSNTAQIAPESFDILRKDPTAVQAVISRRANVASYGDFLDDVMLRDVDVVQQAGKESRQAVSAIFESNKNKISSMVPENFQVSPKDLTEDLMADFVNLGLLDAKTANEAVGKAAEKIAEREFTISSQSAAIKLAQERGDAQMLQLVSDPQAYSQMQKAVRQILDVRGLKGAKAGSEAVEQLMSAKRSLGQITNTIKNQTSEGSQSLYQVANKMTEINAKVDAKFLEHLPTEQARSAYKGMNSAYADALDISDKLFSAANDPVKARQIVQAMRGQGAGGTFDRTAMARLRSHASTSGGGQGKVLADRLTGHIDTLDMSKAAIDFTRPAKMSMTPGTLAAAAAFTGVTGGVGAVPAVIGLAATQSPGVGLAAAKSALKVNNFLRNIPPNLLPGFVKDPANWAAITRTIIQAPEIEAQTKDALMQQVK